VGLVIFQLVTVRPNSVVIFSFDSQTVSATPTVLPRPLLQKYDCNIGGKVESRSTR